MALRDWVRRPVQFVTGLYRRSVAIYNLASEEAARAFGFVRNTMSGVAVTDRTALESVEYAAGVRNVSEDFATLPCITYRRTDDRGRNRERDPDHELYPILHDQPNEEMDSVQFFEMQQAWLMMKRNCYAEIQRSNGGKVVGLWPIVPAKVRPQRIDGELFYRITLPHGEKDPVTGLDHSMLHRSKILHVKAFALDGLIGEDPIEMHREAIGLARALDIYGGTFFGNDASFGGHYETDQTLEDETHARMKKELIDDNRGLEKRHRIGLLEQGLTYKAHTVENDKAQFLESKRYSTEQMARINRITPHKIGDLSRAHFNNVEEQGIDYITSTLRPPAVRWERAILTQLFSLRDRKTHFSEFLLEAHLRGDSAGEASALQIMRQNGVINADEWRALKNMNEIPDGSGKLYLVNAGMIAANREPSLVDKVNALGAYVRAGFDPEKAAKVLGLEYVPHSGAPPVTVQADPEPKPLLADDEAARVFRPLFVAAASRCLQKEAAAVVKAIERGTRDDKPLQIADFERWVVRFYEDQQTTIRMAFGPIAASVGEALRGPDGPDLAEWAGEYARTVATARYNVVAAEMRTLVASHPSDLPGALKKMAAGWTGQAGAMADRELGEMVTSLRRHLAKDPGLAA